MKAICISRFRGLLLRERIRVLQVAAILLAGWFVFAPAFHGDWLWDDFEIRDNPILHSGPGLGKIWFEPASADYFPIEASVLWVEWHLWHENLLGYHLVTTGLHLLGALLIWRLLEKLGVRPAWLGGLLFAVHPLVVESVAWIAELKNTLSLPPLLMAFSSYIDYDREREAGKKCRLGIPLRSVLWFLAAMLCKSSVAMLPLILLLYAWSRRGRVGKAEIRDTVPFFAIAIVLGLVTVHFQIHRALGRWRIPDRNAIEHVADTGLALGFYFWKCVFPSGLVPIYPPWTISLHSLAPFLPWTALVAAAAAFATRRTPRDRGIAFGIGWFAINLLPVLGFVPMSFQHISPVADHLAYVPLIGILGLATAGFGGIWTWTSARRPVALPLLAVGTAAAIGALAWSARQYAGVFVNQETEWTYALRHNARSPMVYLNLAFVQDQAGREAEAAASYESAIRLDPNDPEIENGVGNFFVEREHISQAIPHYERALGLDRTLLATRRSLANALYKTHKYSDAIVEYRQALSESPRDAEMETNLGKALADSGGQYEAMVHFRRALEIDPDDAEAENSLGLALAGSGRSEEGIRHLTQALRLNADFAEAHNNLGFALASLGRLGEAIPHFEEALRLKPKFGQAHNNLGFALAASGRTREAIGQFEQALQIEPDDAKAHYNLAHLLETAGDISGSIAHLEAALRLRPDFANARLDLHRLKAVELIENAGLK